MRRGRGRDEAVVPQRVGDGGPPGQGPQEGDRQDRGPDALQEEGRHPSHPRHSRRP